MNEKKFTGKGAVYASSRPAYPRALFDTLTSRGVLLPTSTAADIGAGTGIFTGILSEYVEKVYAVEPNSDMRDSAAKNGIKPNAVFVNGNAEHTGLPDGSVDIITAAQAFHWFDAVAFAEECKRIFRPRGEGFVVLVWNDRDAESDIVKANFDINRKFCPLFKNSSVGMDIGGSVSRFFDGRFDVFTFDNGCMYDENAFLRRNLSSSYAPLPDDAAFAPYVEALREVFSASNSDGKVFYPYITRCYAGKL